MNHYMDFDPYLIRERNQQVQRDVNSLRLEERLRKEHGSSGSRFVTLAKRGVMPLLRAAHSQGSHCYVACRGLAHRAEGGGVYAPQRKLMITEGRVVASAFPK